MKKFVLLVFVGILSLPYLKAQTPITFLNQEKLLHTLYETTNHHLADSARKHQTQGIGYNPDDWYNTYLHKGDTIEQGMPEPGYYFTTKNNHILHDSAFTFSASLQIKKGIHPSYRSKVRLCVVTADSVPAAIGKALKNDITEDSKKLSGGAWQFFIKDTNLLTPLHPEISLK